jgi:hypothetical protein
MADSNGILETLQTKLDGDIEELDGAIRRAEDDPEDLVVPIGPEGFRLAPWERRAFLDWRTQEAADSEWAAVIALGISLAYRIHQDLAHLEEEELLPQEERGTASRALEEDQRLGSRLMEEFHRLHNQLVLSKKTEADSRLAEFRQRLRLLLSSSRGNTGSVVPEVPRPSSTAASSPSVAAASPRAALPTSSVVRPKSRTSKTRPSSPRPSNGLVARFRELSPRLRIGILVAMALLLVQVGVWISQIPPSPTPIAKEDFASIPQVVAVETAPPVASITLNEDWKKWGKFERKNLAREIGRILEQHNFVRGDLFVAGSTQRVGQYFKGGGVSVDRD